MDVSQLHDFIVATANAHLTSARYQEVMVARAEAYTESCYKIVGSSTFICARVTSLAGEPKLTMAIFRHGRDEVVSSIIICQEKAKSQVHFSVATAIVRSEHPAYTEEQTFKTAMKDAFKRQFPDYTPEQVHIAVMVAYAKSTRNATLADLAAGVLGKYEIVTKLIREYCPRTISEHYFKK